MLAGVGRRPLHLAGRAAEARRGRRLHDAVELDERARGATLCGCCGASASDSTGAKQTSVPSMISHHSSRVFVLEDRREPLLHAPATASCRAATAGRSPSRPVSCEQLGVELRLDRADRHVLAVGRLVDVVEVGAGVEQVRAPLVLPDAHRPEGVEHRHEAGGAVDHGRVDHLALARALRLEQRRTPCRRRGACRRRRSRRRG